MKATDITTSPVITVGPATAVAVSEVDLLHRQDSAVSVTPDTPAAEIADLQGD